MKKPYMYYSSINRGHSIGIELEYLLTKDGKPYDYLDFFIQEFIAQLPGINRRRNSAKVYQDAWQLEICSSPHTNISDLYEETGRLYRCLCSKAEDNGLEIIKEAAHSFSKDDDWKSTERVSGLHVHLGNAWLTRPKFLEGLMPYLPLFIALSNNSPTEEFPNGSRRLREGEYAKDLDRGINKEELAICRHKIAPTVEVRCMDRSKSIDEDVANAAFIFATAEKIKEGMDYSSLFKNLAEKNFKSLYGTEEKINKDSLITATRILMQRAAHDGFDASISLRNRNGFSKETLADVAKRHYLEIQDKLDEVDTPPHLIKILDRKVMEK